MAVDAEGGSERGQLCLNCLGWHVVWGQVRRVRLVILVNGVAQLDATALERG